MNLEQVKQVWKNKGKIFEGLKNRIIADQNIKSIATDRLLICQSNKCGAYDLTGKGCVVKGTQPCCSNIPDANGVKGCGCSLKIAAYSMSKDCRKGFWAAVMDENKEDELRTELELPLKN